MSKNEFLQVYDNAIHREGYAELREWLLETDFFTAPASTRFHLSEEGGLAKHSLGVYNRFCDETSNKASDETIAICSLLHDVCKANYYKIEFRNAKNASGAWEKVPYYTVDDKFPYGHGEKSVFIISRFMKLTMEESIAIRWHMGGFDEAVKGGSYSLNSAYEQYPLALLLHVADMKATYLDERKI
jgi:hypothetical protein